MLLAHDLLQPLGFTVLESCQALMAFGGAVTAAAGHRTALATNLAPRPARWAALLVAATPAITYYATIVELQSMAMAMASLAIWALVLLGRRTEATASPPWVCAAALGILSALGAAHHTSLHLLPLAFPWIALLGLWQPATPKVMAWRWAPTLAAVAASHCLVYQMLLWASANTEVAAGTKHLLYSGLNEQANSAGVWQRLVGELLLPFLPCNLVVIATLLRRFNLATIALIVGVGGAFTATVLALRTVINDENGAYLFCYAAPFAVIAIRKSPSKMWPALLGVALITSGWLRWQRAIARPTDRDIARACQTLSEREAYTFLTSDGVLIDSTTLYAPELKVIPYQLDQPLQALPKLVADYYDALALAALPSSLVIDEATWQEWAAGDSPALKALVTEHLPQKYHIKKLQSGSYQGRAISVRAR